MRRFPGPAAYKMPRRPLSSRSASRRVLVCCVGMPARRAHLLLRIAKFWVDGYTFFFDLAQSIAAGERVSEVHRRHFVFPIRSSSPAWAIKHSGPRDRPVRNTRMRPPLRRPACVPIVPRTRRRSRRRPLLAAAITAVSSYSTTLHSRKPALFLALHRRGCACSRAGSAGRRTPSTGLLAPIRLELLTRATIAPFAALAPVLAFGKLAKHGPPWPCRCF